MEAQLRGMGLLGFVLLLNISNMNIALIKNNKVDNIIVIDEQTDNAYFSLVMSTHDAVIPADGYNIGDDYPKVVTVV